MTVTSVYCNGLILRVIATQAGSGFQNWNVQGDYSEEIFYQVSVKSDLFTGKYSAYLS